MNKKILIGVGVGALVLIGGGIFLYSQRKKDQLDLGTGATDALGNPISGGGMDMTNEKSIPNGLVGSSVEPNYTPSTPVAPQSKKDTISTWKSDKTRIKAICGRRRILGKKKSEWLHCVAREGGNANDSFYNMGGNHIEVGYTLTDL